ncbi:unnamed protein product [Closterium sp. Yama58-4]|nr:unnamed protein product [Closterium sp. Yama58-4]
MSYDEVEIEDMEWNEELGAFTYSCPCGDLFQITLEELKNGEEIARCPSCSLFITVIYNSEDFQGDGPGKVEHTVVVLDPDVDKQYLDKIQHRTKEKHFSFDRAFSGISSNVVSCETTKNLHLEDLLRLGKHYYDNAQEIYTPTVQPMIQGLTEGLNATVFAYGATGSLGYFGQIIYDLLVESSGSLELREDPGQGVSVAGLKRIKVQSAGKILDLLRQGNLRRKTESTDANLTSSSERASETNNMGQQLRDGANINKSLLALSNCINALCQQQKRGVGYVPYRNSKLTRLLKDGLSGNSRTTMVATICPAADQYHHIINTLKYADRAKEIKTRIRTNVRTVDSQSGDYLRMIEKLQDEVSMLKGQLAEQATTSSMNPVGDPSGTSWLDDISRQLNENVQERINMQKAMCELNECLKRAGDEVCRLDQKIAILQNEEDISMKLDELRHQRAAIVESMCENEELKLLYAKDISNNEAERELLQKRLDSFVSNHENSSFLHILNQFRFLSVEMTEMQFQMALRDQLIVEKTSAMNSLWMLLQASDIDIEELLDAAVQKGVPLDSSLSSYIDVKLKEAIATPNGSPKFAQSVFRAAARTVHSRLHRVNTDPAGSLSRPYLPFSPSDQRNVADFPTEDKITAREDGVQGILEAPAANVPFTQNATNGSLSAKPIHQEQHIDTLVTEPDTGEVGANMVRESVLANTLLMSEAMLRISPMELSGAEAEMCDSPSGSTTPPRTAAIQVCAKVLGEVPTSRPKTSSPRKRSVWHEKLGTSSSPSSPARRAGSPGALATGPRRPVPKERKISAFHTKLERRTDVECGAAGRAVWNHRFNFLLPDREQDYPPEMDVHIWDKVNGQDKYMGFCKVHLEQVYLRQSMDAVWPVHQRNGKLLGHIRFHFSILVEDVNGDGALPSAPPETPTPLLEHSRVNRRTNTSIGIATTLTAPVQEASNKAVACSGNALGAYNKGKAADSSVTAAAASNEALEPQPKRINPSSAAPPAAMPSSPMGPPSPNSLRFSPSKAFKKVTASSRHAVRPGSCNGAGNTTDCTDGGSGAVTAIDARPSIADVDSRDSQTALASSAVQRFTNNGAAGFAPAKPLPPLSVIGGGDGANDGHAATEAASAFAPVHQRSGAATSSGGPALASALTAFASTASASAASTVGGAHRSAAQPLSTPDALAADVLTKGWDLSAIASLTSAVLSASGKGTPQGKNSMTSVAAATAAAGTRPGGVSASSAPANGAPSGARAGTGANRQAILNQELIAEALCMALLGEAGKAEPARKQGKNADPGAAGPNGSKRSWELQLEKREVGVGAGIGADDVVDEGPKRQRIA